MKDGAGGLGSVMKVGAQALGNGQNPLAPLLLPTLHIVVVVHEAIDVDSGPLRRPVWDGMILLVLEWLRRDIGAEATLPGEEVPAWIVGTVERSFFTLAVAAGLPGVSAAMILWIATRMAAGWGSAAQETPNIEVLRLTALLGGVVSMTFALVGGWVVRVGWLMVA